jgi:transcription elongation GreA/GreB family factor
LRNASTAAASGAISPVNPLAKAWLDVALDDEIDLTLEECLQQILGVEVVIEGRLMELDE